MDVNDAVEKCMNRHKNLYGIVETSDEEDAKILEEERKKYEDIADNNSDKIYHS